MDMLGRLPYRTGMVTRQISAENPTGEKSGACHAVPDPSNPAQAYDHYAKNLGKGWKVNPFIRVKAGETVILADIEGPGCISEFFITSDYANLSELVLRFYWDEEDEPSVEVPMGAFFCIGHDKRPHTVSSLPVTVAPHRGCSCYWEMPFRRHARITLTHDGETDANVVAWRVLYHLCGIPEDAAYFHAQYRRTVTSRSNPEHVILDGVKGKGLYVGTYLAWNALNSGWWGEGEVKFYLDGDTEYPTLCDNGTEDYFGGAWNFGGYMGPGSRETVFESPFLGMPLASVDHPDGPKKIDLYRWHIRDCIGFSEDIRVTVQTLSWYPNQTYKPASDDVASVAYYYQAEPHHTFPKFPSVEERWDR
ncbi:MAG: glycoside hydrolase family 172 protein [Aristaeellaceae bacterium]